MLENLTELIIFMLFIVLGVIISTGIMMFIISIVDRE